MKLFLHFGIATVLFFFLFGCSAYQIPRYEKIADEITAKTAEKLKKEKKLCLIGTGGGMMHDIQMMSMSFNYYQEVDLKIARELLLYVVNAYLTNINSNKEVRPYLHEYPFTAKNIEIRIYIYNSDGTEISPNKINAISSIDGNLRYSAINTEKFTRDIFLKETYEEGMKKLQEK